MSIKMLIINHLSQKIFSFIVKSRFKYPARSRRSTFALLDVLKSFIKPTSLSLRLHSFILILIVFVADIIHSV